MQQETAPTRFGISRILIGIAAFGLASHAFAAPYTVELTSVGDGANNGAVYYDPYVGTITDNATKTVIYTGYLICDDYNTESHVGDPWQATETNAGMLNGSEKFAGESYTVGGKTYNTAQMYSAAAWLANQLLLPANVTNPAAQGTLSFAIWDIMDGTAGSGAVGSEIDSAFGKVNSGYMGSNVEVVTPDPFTSSQEFLLVNVPEPSTGALFGIALAGLLGALALRRRPRAG